MNIPNFVNAPIADKDGNLTVEWANLLQQLLTELQLNAGAEGLKPSPLPTVDINALVDADLSTGAMVYDTTTNELKVNINGTWRVVTVV